MYGPVAGPARIRQSVDVSRQYADKNIVYLVQPVGVFPLGRGIGNHTSADQHQKRPKTRCPRIRICTDGDRNSEGPDHTADYKDQIDIQICRLCRVARKVYSGSELKIKRSAQGATRRILVEPGVLNGTPAVTTIMSSSVANS